MTSVLVADDPFHANLVDLALSDYGFSVGVAHSTDEALAALRSSPVDVLLADLQLGKSDGIDLLKATGRLSPRTRGVLMTGFATPQDYQRAVDVGAVRVLCKPFTVPDLIRCVRHAVECDTGFHGSIHGLSLIDVLQMFNASRRSISIAVAGLGSGSLHLRDGQIIHAEHGRRTGEAALCSLLALRAGAFSTAALPEDVEQSITRDFRELLLGALCAIDEAALGKGDLLLDGAQPTTADPATPDAHDGPAAEDVDLDATSRSARRILDAVRGFDGHQAARVVLSRDGRVVGCHGPLELWQSVKPSWEAAVARTGADNPVDEIMIAATHHYHLLHAIHSKIPAFVHLVLDRRSANLGMARLALAAVAKAAVNSVDC